MLFVVVFIVAMLHVSLNSSCSASCDAGYKFPGGLTSDKRDCDQMFGEWFDPPGTDIPNCIRK